MTKTEIISLIHQPEQITPVQTRALSELSQKYPWCQFVQMLYTKGLHLERSVDYLDSLKFTAALTSDRKLLYDQIMKPSLMKKIRAIEEENLSHDKAELLEDNNESVQEEQQELVDKNTNSDRINHSGEEVVITKDLLDEIIARKIEEKQISSGVIVPNNNPGKDERTTSGENEEKYSEENAPIEASVDSGKYSELEKQILWEAVNASIQVDVTSELEKMPELEAAKNSPLLDELLKSYEEEVKPIDFDSKKSFFTWLAPTHPLADDAPPEKREEKKETEDLIDKFLKNDPKITPQKTEFYTPGNVAKLSITDSEDFVSETLAMIYIKQGYYAKAARVFEKLSLKFPEKSPYFAARLKELEALQKSNKK